MSIGDYLLVNHVFKLCTIIIVDNESLVYLIVLKPLQLDVILRMDWLATYHATIDYYAKTIKFSLMREPLLWCKVTQI